MPRSRKLVTIDGVSPALIAFLAERVPDVNMRFPANQATLKRWLRRYSESEIVRRFEGVSDYCYPTGGTIYREEGRPPPANRMKFLKNWEWEVTQPFEVVYAFAL